MEFIKPKNIGKIYSQDHTATVGIQKVNLTFQKGEFVAVTGAFAFAT